MKTFFFLFFIFVYDSVDAQVPQALNYQGVARSSNGNMLPSQNIGIRFSILDQTATGNVLYQETHQSITNNFGLFTLAIGRGATLSGSFAAISWGTGPKFLKVEISTLGTSNYQLQGTTQLLSVPYALYAEKSGNAGTQGPAGINGLSILNGTVNPPNGMGVNGEFYINTSTNQLFGPKTPSGWGTGTSLIGAAGSTGPQGPLGLQGSQGIQGVQGPAGVQGITGTNGLSLLNGTVNPLVSTGVNGDFYLNTSTNQLFGPKSSGSWGSGVNLVGPSGATGPQGNPGPTGATGAQGPTGITGPAGTTGPQGVAGTNGSNGKTILNGVVNPLASTGTDGDFYLNTQTMQIFGPKSLGAWGAGINLTGPAGTPGLKSLIDLENFASTLTCSTGGILVKSGIDQNNNNILDAAEVNNVKQICFTQNTFLDKVIMIPLGYSGYAYSSTTPYIYGSFPTTFKFNKHNYPGVDSITLVCLPRIYDAGNNVIVKLYNLTDNIPIVNSTITGNGSTGYMESANVFNSLPDYPINLGISVASSVQGQTASAGICTLYLYRR